MPFACNPEEFLQTQAEDDYAPPGEMLSAFRKLLSDSSPSMKEIAKEVAGPIIRDFKNADPKIPECDSLWRLLKDAVDQFGQEHNDKFVEFVVELQKLPDEDNLFGDLPQFRNHWTEFGYTTQDWPADEEDREEKRRAQTNQHAFLAKLTTTGVPYLESEIDRASHILRVTCEFAPWEKTHWPDVEELYDPEDEEDWPETRDRELEQYDIKTLNAYVPCAAQWIKIHAQRLYEMKGEMTEYAWQDEEFAGKWKGEKGWSKERFSFWRERFEWIAKVTALEKSTQRLATECAEIMKSVEEGNKGKA